MMVLPREETLVYLEKVNDWIASEEMTDNGIILIFKRDVPSDVMTLFEKVKDKMDFKVKEYRKEG